MGWVEQVYDEESGESVQEIERVSGDDAKLCEERELKENNVTMLVDNTATPWIMIYQTFLPIFFSIPLS